MTSTSDAYDALLAQCEKWTTPLIGSDGLMAFHARAAAVLLGQLRQTGQVTQVELEAITKLLARHQRLMAGAIEAAAPVPYGCVRCGDPVYMYSVEAGQWLCSQHFDEVANAS